MLTLEFYHNLPKKECKCCGSEIEEMHECYTDECDCCLGKYEE